MSAMLVTGGAGFIGGAFARQMLRESDSRVVNLDKLTYAGNLDSLQEAASHARHVFIQGDIDDSPLVERLLREHRVEAIVNFAAESHVDRSIDGPSPFVETNVVGTFRLLEAALAYWKTLNDPQRSRFRFLHVSTDEVYGSLGADGKFSETSPYRPNSPYSASKAAADHFARAYFQTYGLPVLLTNSSNNYGSHQFPEKLIPLVILNCLSGRALPIYGNGSQVRDWLYVEDHCRALRLVLQEGAPGEVYNIGAACERTNLEVVEAICREVDRQRPDLAHGPCRSLITYVTDRPGHDRRYAVDAPKLRSRLGWAPSVDFETGLQRTVRWYLDNPTWTNRVLSGDYRLERLGLGREVDHVAL